MKKKNILKGAVVLLIAAVMVITSVGVTADTSTIRISSSDTLTTNYSHENRQNIVWDNNMSYLGLIRAQYDSSIPLDCYPADDFHFTEDTQVCDVHWVGGYWFGNYQQGDFDWVIKFYEDRGDGNAPGAEYAGPFNFTWDQITKVFLQDNGIMILYDLSVDLPQNILFHGCEKYWISIWGIGFEPPNSGWGFHYDPILLHKAMVQSFYFFEDNEWHSAEELSYEPSDLCFQLTTKENEPPTPPTIYGPANGKVGTSYTYTFTSTDPNGDQVSYYVDWGDGTPASWSAFQASGTPYSASHTWSTQGTYNITAKAKDIYGAESDWSTLEVTMPKNKPFNFNYPLLSWLFERFPNAFPILRHVLDL